MSYGKKEREGVTKVFETNKKKIIVIIGEKVEPIACRNNRLHANRQ